MCMMVATRAVPDMVAAGDPMSKYQNVAGDFCWAKGWVSTKKMVAAGLLATGGTAWYRFTHTGVLKRAKVC